MHRRVALKNIAVTLGGLISLPAWANGWTQGASMPAQSYLSLDQDALLAEISETIIPATDTPGAKALGVHRFVQKIVADCYEKEVQVTLTQGLDAAETLAKQSLGKSFASADANERISLLQHLALSDEANQKDFYSLVKELTIRGYLNSEYVMTNLTHYELIPGRYHGCVPVAAK